MLPRPLRLALVILLVALAPGLLAAAQTNTPVPDSPPAASVAANYPPIAGVSIVPRRIIYLDSGPSAGVQVLADATPSEDPEGQPLTYSSDVNGDGVFTSWFFRPEAMELVNAPGPFLVTVRARDPLGAVGQLQIPMLARRFTRSLADGASTPAIGFGVVNGRPAFVYDRDDGNIVITASDTADGLGRWTRATVRDEDVVSKWLGLSKYTWVASCRLAEGWVVGTLCTFNLNNGGYELRYLASDDVFSGEWYDTEVVRLNGDPAPTLGMIQNTPAVLYFNNGALTLVVGSWGTKDAVMVSEGFELLWSHDVGKAPPATHSAVVPVGEKLNLPAYVYLDAAKAQLMYTVNQQPDGRGKWDTYPIEMQANDTGAPSLAMVAGRPAVAYHDGFRGDLKLALNDKADGRGKWQVTVVYPYTKDSPRTQSLADIGGRAGIAFEDAEHGLLFAYDPGAPTGNYWPVARVDSRTYPGIRREPVLVDIDGKPAIGYGPYSVQFAVAR